MHFPSNNHPFSGAHLNTNCKNGLELPEQLVAPLAHRWSFPDPSYGMHIKGRGVFFFRVFPFFRILLLLRFCFCCFFAFVAFCFCFSASAAFVAFLLLLFCFCCFWCFSASCFSASAAFLLFVFLFFCSLLLLLFCFGSCSPFSFCFAFPSVCFLTFGSGVLLGGALRPPQPPPRHEICTSSPTPAPATKSIF